MRSTLELLVPYLAFFAVFRLTSMIAADPPATPLASSGNGQSIAFRVGTLLSQFTPKTTGQEENGGVQLQQAAAEEADCQLQLAVRLHVQMVQQTQLDIGRNLLAQLHPERLQQICKIYKAHSTVLNDCYQRRSKNSPALSPFILVLQTVCWQFHEALETHGSCMAELGLARLETECTEACQRQARSQQSTTLESFAPSAASATLCQLATCATRCVGMQMSECAEEAEGQRAPNPATGQQLRALAEQLAGLQMLLAVQEQITPLKRASEYAQKQMPAECAQMVTKAVYAAQFVSNHEAMPEQQF